MGDFLGDVGKSLAGGFPGFLGGLFTNESQVGLSREQMAWQERMAGSAHQREMRDYERAGLNPILSATGGMGASTPTGSVAQLENPAVAFSSSAFDAIRLGQDISESDSRIAANRSAANLSDSSAAVNAASAKKLGLEMPEIELRKHLYERASRYLPMLDRYLDSLDNSAKPKPFGGRAVPGSSGPGLSQDQIDYYSQP